MVDSVTPMMRQYRRIKGEMPPDVVVFFRLGDFYEMFFEDAQVAAPILDIALTKRNNVPMCGVPYHAVDAYLARMIKAGKKVAICDQVGDPAASKGIVKREVTRVVTPGTVTEDSILDSSRHNFLAGIYRADDSYGLALLDLSTGTFVAEQTDSAAALADNLERFGPAELVLAESQVGDESIAGIVKSAMGIQVNMGGDWTFDYDGAYDHLVRHFGVQSLEGYGCEGNRAIVGACGGALLYVKEDLRRNVEHIKSLRVRRSADFLLLDQSTCVNLDLVPLAGRSGSMTLLDVLDDTRTAMGGRMLREWLLRPLASVDAIRARHDALEAMCGARPLLSELREALGQIRDLERLATRIGIGSGNARDVRAVGSSLSSVPAVRTVTKALSPGLLSELATRLVDLPELVSLIDSAIADEPPVTIKEGGVIRPGYNTDLDALRAAATEGKQWLAEYQGGERERTGIKSLKVRHNKVFGYYLEVSRGQLSNVPDDYARKQTLVNAERFITPELKEYENRVIGAQEKAMALEHELFLAVRDAVVAETGRIQTCAEALAQLDVLADLAGKALTNRYVRPEMTESDVLNIKQGRHPVVEQMPDAERFVPNDVCLDCSQNQLIIITGPNMAGKSTYIRQVAMIVIMAQVGSFVPADAAEVGTVDRVFTRVGASDDLAGGRSTFMVEMQETANILNNATPRSLIVLDEIGRGTSTFDGISIAWAVAEYLHNHGEVKARTLFATHYHELTDLEMTLSGVKNYNVLVRERNDSVVFLRRIDRGGADKSYGIQVARLAGMPTEVIERSKEILGNLEEGEFGESGQPKLAKQRKPRGRADGRQMDLFGT